MKSLTCILLALLATALTVLIMPILASIGSATPSKLSFTAIRIIRPQPSAKRPLLPPMMPLPRPIRPASPPPAPPHPVHLTPPAPPHQPPPIPSLQLSPALPALTLPEIPLHLSFALKVSPSSPVPQSVASAGESPRQSVSRSSASGAGSQQASPAEPANTPLAEKHIVTPSFPRNAAPVNGSVHVAFTVEPDGTVSQVTVTACDPQLSFKYRREAIRAALNSTYYPATRNGKPIAIRATRRIDFIIP